MPITRFGNQESGACGLATAFASVYHSRIEPARRIGGTMHYCPECGQACTCNGDIDDIDTGDDSGCQCTCDEMGEYEIDFEEEEEP